MLHFTGDNQEYNCQYIDVRDKAKERAMSRNWMNPREKNDCQEFNFIFDMAALVLNSQSAGILIHAHLY